MLLVAGGQLDPNIGRLLRRLLHRRVPFHDLLIGPELCPTISFEIESDGLYINDHLLKPSAGFVRHDVFLQQEANDAFASATALNWYHAVRGWLLMSDQVRSFNRNSEGSEHNKIRNLSAAIRTGFSIPVTRITNQFDGLASGDSDFIQKPVAGGELTTTVAAFTEKRRALPALGRYPRFIQERLIRPELRIYRIGDAVLGFHLSSEDVDYREHQRVALKTADVSSELAEKFVALCDQIGLQFAAGDFMKDPVNGDYRFLEINSQPMFAAFDIASDGKLCDAIIDYLCG